MVDNFKQGLEFDRDRSPQPRGCYPRLEKHLILQNEIEVGEIYNDYDGDWVAKFDNKITRHSSLERAKGYVLGFYDSNVILSERLDKLER